MGTSTTRTTLASTNVRLDDVEGKLDRLLAVLEGDKPAKVTRKRTAKRTTKRTAKKATVKVTQGARAYGTGGLTRRQWNNTVSTKLRLAGKVKKGTNKGKSFYALFVQDTEAWAQIRASRLEGLTPDQVVAEARKVA